MPDNVSNASVRDYWEAHPVAAAALTVEPGDPDYFRQFDLLRERPDCEPPWVGEAVHGYRGARGLRVLDVGCGNGYVLSRYASQGAEAHGIDLTEQAVRLSRQRFALAGLEGVFQTTDGDHIPYGDDRFDIVCAMGVLHHVADPRPMLAEMHRVLKPGGRLILMLYHRHSHRNLILFPLLKLLHPRYRGRTLQQIRNANDGEGCPLALVYSRRQAAALLTAFEGIGFRVNQLGWHDLFGHTPLSRWLERRWPDLSHSFYARTFGWNLYVSARKGGGGTP